MRDVWAIFSNMIREWERNWELFQGELMGGPDSRKLYEYFKII